MATANSKSQFDDVRATLTYGFSHDNARKFIPIGLFAIAIGLVILASLDGRAVAGKHVALGSVVILGAFVLLGMALYRRSQPNVPSLIIAPEGIVFRDISESRIPWREIKSVALDKVSGSRDLRSTRVVRLDVSNAFYQRYSGGRWLASQVARDGEPAAIYLSYFTKIPVEDVYHAIERRWYYYTRAAGAIDDVQETSATEARPTAVRESAIRKASAASPIGLLRDMAAQMPVGERLASLAALGAIAAMLTNIAGVWSFEQQRIGHAREAEWQAQRAKWDAEEKAAAEERRKSDQKWDAIKKCMDQMGSIGEDPNCMSKIK